MGVKSIYSKIPKSTMGTKKNPMMDRPIVGGKATGSDLVKQPLRSSATSIPYLTRQWGETRPGYNYPAVEGPGNPSWEKRNPTLEPGYEKRLAPNLSRVATTTATASSTRYGSTPRGKATKTNRYAKRTSRYT